MNELAAAIVEGVEATSNHDLVQHRLGEIVLAIEDATCGLAHRVASGQGTEKETRQIDIIESFCRSLSREEWEGDDLPTGGSPLDASYRFAGFGPLGGLHLCVGLPTGGDRGTVLSDSTVCKADLGSDVVATLRGNKLSDADKIL